MNKTSKISVWQLFSVILLSRLLTLLTYTTFGLDRMHNADFFASVLFCTAFVALFSTMVFIQSKLFPEKDMTDIAYIASPLLSKGVSVCYAFYFIFAALTTLVRLELFVSSIVFPDTDSTLFAVICIIAACYAATLGIEGIGRASVLSLAIFNAAFLFIVLTMADEIDFVNFSPIFFDGITPSIKAGLNSATRTVEVVMLTALLPKTKGKPMRIYTAWLLVFAVYKLILFFCTFGGLGDYALTQLFPVYAMSVLSEVGVFRRFDVLLTGVWILSAFIKISLLFYLQAELLQKSFRKSWRIGYILIAGALVLIVQIGMGGTFADYFFSTTLLTRTLFYAAFTLVLPGVVLLAAYRKGKKRHEKTA